MLLVLSTGQGDFSRRGVNEFFAGVCVCVCGGGGWGGGVDPETIST